MTTLIRPEISKRNEFWISKHRYYELKHFCLQYPEWKRIIAEYSYLKGRSVVAKTGKQLEYIDPTLDILEYLEGFQKNIELVEQSCELSDSVLKPYLIESVGYGKTFEYLLSVKHMPCSRSTFYRAYRKVFWNLDRLKT